MNSTGRRERQLSSFWILVILLGFSLSFFSVPIFLDGQVHAIEIDCSRDYYTNHLLTVLPNDTSCIDLGGLSGLPEGHILRISFALQSGCVNFEIAHKERIIYGTGYGDDVTVSGSRRLAFPIYGFPLDWTILQSHPDVSFLNITYRLPSEGLYNLRFSNAELRDSREVNLSVTRSWTEASETENVRFSMLPPLFLYPGFLFILTGALAIIYMRVRNRLWRVDSR